MNGAVVWTLTGPDPLGPPHCPTPYLWLRAAEVLKSQNCTLDFGPVFSKNSLDRTKFYQTESKYTNNLRIHGVKSQWGLISKGLFFKKKKRHIYLAPAHPNYHYFVHSPICVLKPNVSVKRWAEPGMEIIDCPTVRDR